MCNNLANSIWVDKTFNTVITKNTHKIIEHVVNSRVTEHLSSNNLLNPHQSANVMLHHSIETALLYIHDHLINATGSQKISCLCLLDHSVDFGTTDHGTEPFRSRANSFPGANRPIGPWPICSLELLLLGPFALLKNLARKCCSCILYNLCSDGDVCQ